jgi:hypothetical protein
LKILLDPDALVAALLMSAFALSLKDKLKDFSFNFDMLCTKK